MSHDDDIEERVKNLLLTQYRNDPKEFWKDVDEGIDLVHQKSGKRLTYKEFLETIYSFTSDEIDQCLRGDSIPITITPIA